MAAAAAAAGDSWDGEYNEAVKLGEDITNLISEGSSQYNSSAIWTKITILETRLNTLQALCTFSNLALSREELNRRKDTIANLRSMVNQMVSILSTYKSTAKIDTLLGSEIAPVDAVSRTTGMDNYDIVALQTQIMKEQDEDLAKIVETITSTKHIALAFQEVLDPRTRLLDNQHYEHVEFRDDIDSRLQRVQRRLASLNERRCSCFYMFLSITGIVVLVVAIYILIKHL